MGMGQSVLIDMNSGWYKHKSEFNDGLKTRSYLQVLGALDALNAILPDDYRVRIDTKEYDDAVRGALSAFCNYCETDYPDPADKTKTVSLPTKHDAARIVRRTVLLSPELQMITGRKFDTFWRCDTCGRDNLLGGTTFRRTVLRKPFYLKVVPEPPLNAGGIAGKTDFHHKFESWARGFLAELNAEARRFRADYKPKDGEIDDFEADFGDDIDLD